MHEQPTVKAVVGDSLREVPEGIRITVQGTEYMRNARGDLVPTENVRDVDILRDQMVREIIDEVIGMSNGLRALKQKIYAEAESFLALSLEKYGVRYAGRKGNVTLTTYDGQYKLVINHQDVLSFDERLQAAKALIDRCIHTWSAGANDNLRVLVNDAFKVDKQGNVDTRRILELRKYAIDDPDWANAMNAIGESITVLMSRCYVRCYRRKGTEDGYTLIPLDFAAL